jgi:mannobiose 2-epimerase
LLFPRGYLAVAAQVEDNLQRQVLAKWFPAADDPRGGFHEQYNRRWQLGPDEQRHIVYQSRLTWTSAVAMSRFPASAAMYREQSAHGLTFLADRLWDAAHGGFFWDVDPSGKPVDAQGRWKIAYGNAFGIYAAAANYQATHDPSALQLAQKAFTWYDAHGHDAAHGGYLEVAGEDFPGAPQPSPSASSPIGGRVGQKSMNTSIHLLEALTALQQAAPDPLVKRRLEEMFHLVRDRIYAEPGHLVMFFSADWQPQPTEDSYGHDVETAYLLVEAAGVLGIPDDPATWHAARALVDHALAVAVNPAGGLYNSGNVDGGNYSPDREWWTQAEWLNALLLMHERFGRETPRYWNAFLAQWKWIQKVEIDPADGGWFAHVTNDNHGGNGPKSDAWTDCYHQGRALLNVSARLRALAAQP